MKVLGENSFEDICCNSMITALQKEVFWAHNRPDEGLVFGFENIQWHQEAGEFIPKDFVVVDFCPFCGKPVSLVKV